MRARMIRQIRSSMKWGFAAGSRVSPGHWRSDAVAQTATILSLSFYVTNAAGKLMLGIYDATGKSGGPGALKTQTNSSSLYACCRLEYDKRYRTRISNSLARGAAG
jgi:hypothetical protein